MSNKVSDANLNYLRRFAPNLTDEKILAEFSNLDLQTEELDAKSRYDIAEKLIEGYDAQLLVATEQREKTELQQAITKSRGDKQF